MAKRIDKPAPETVEAPVTAPTEETKEEAAPVAEQANETPEAPTEETKEETETKVEAQTTDIPDTANAMLKLYSDMEYAYVNAKGGVFTKETSASVRGNAVLYKNPYFKH